MSVEETSFVCFESRRAISVTTYLRDVHVAFPIVLTSTKELWVFGALPPCLKFVVGTAFFMQLMFSYSLWLFHAANEYESILLRHEFPTCEAPCRVSTRHRGCAIAAGLMSTRRGDWMHPFCFIIMCACARECELVSVRVCVCVCVRVPVCVISCVRIGTGVYYANVSPV